MPALAHIVNPFDAPASSDLKIAQPITFESMRVAKGMAEGHVAVRQLAAFYAEDEAACPSSLESTPVLERSILDVASLTEARKLPLLGDILDRLYAGSEGADHLVYTNVDIALMPSFYLTVSRLIDQGFDAFVINRRTITDRYSDVGDLPLMYAQTGEPHQGWDCFVFPREAYPDYRIGLVCLGAPWIGRVLLLNLVAFARSFREFKGLHSTFHLGNDRVWDDTRFADLGNFNRSQGAELMNWLEERFDTSDPNAPLTTYIDQGWKWLGRHDIKVRRSSRRRGRR
jgi:hypothetical protein